MEAPFFVLDFGKVTPGQECIPAYVSIVDHAVDVDIYIWSDPYSASNVVQRQRRRLLIAFYSWLEIERIRGKQRNRSKRRRAPGNYVAEGPIPAHISNFKTRS
jgi:hypothetical protein